MRILIIEDEVEVARFLAAALDDAGHESVHATTGAAGLDEAAGRRFDAIVLDVNLPDMLGFDVAAGLRDRGDDTPILVLTSRGAKGDVMRGLDSGADDYLGKPYDVGELLARLRAITRRERVQSRGRLRFGDVEMDLTTHRCSVAGAELDLTPNESKVLAILLRAGGAVVASQDINHEVWGESAAGTSLLSVHLSHLRRKLRDVRSRVVVRTERGVGYRVDAPDELVP